MRQGAQVVGDVVGEAHGEEGGGCQAEDDERQREEGEAQAALVDGLARLVEHREDLGGRRGDDHAPVLVLVWAFASAGRLS